MSVLAIYLIVWILVGLLVGALASLVGNAPPYGVGVDLAAAVLTMIAVGLLDYAILPLLGYTGMIRLIAMVGEPLVGAVAVLWLLRFIKRRRERSTP
jgi:uncharacterized membrane protein YeaQ/YmgE (transglycosylase-associated protein family)